MIVSFLNQKGGTGKSALARTLAVEFVRNDWSVHVADMDVAQSTSFQWAGRRADGELSNAVDVALYRDVNNLSKLDGLYDLLIVDGKAFADTHALQVASLSSLVVIPVGVSVDDLKPALDLAVGLVQKGVDKEKILFVISKVTENGEREAMSSRSSIQNWGFKVTRGWVPLKTAYSQTLDMGKSLTETKYKELNAKADRIIKQIASKLLEK